MNILFKNRLIMLIFLVK